MSNQDTTQAKYRKASKNNNEQPQIENNEVRIKGNQGNVKRYVDYACGLLQNDSEKKTDNNDENNKDNNDDNNDNNKDNNTSNDNDNNNVDNDDNDNKDDKKNDDQDNKKPIKQFKTIVLKATGRAINKAVTTAEVVKRRIAGLHQDTKLETLEIVDVWEPTEEGLKVVKTTRRVASITITLSLDENEIEKMKQSTGYQPPISSDSIKTIDYPVRRFNNRNNNRRGNSNRNYNNRRGNSNRDYNNYNNRDYGNRNRDYGNRNSYGNRNYGGRRGGRGGYGGNRNRNRPRNSNYRQGY